MPKQSEHDSSGDVRFKNLLATAYPIIKAKPFVNIDDDELSFYANYVQYRVQRDLFELFEEESPGTITWDNFLLMMCGTRELRDICMSAICRRMETAFYQFEFTERETYLFDESLIFMALFLLFAQQAHFNYLQDTVRLGCRWEEYHHELLRGGKLWNTAMTAFRDAVQRLDFKPDWSEVEVDGL